MLTRRLSLVAFAAVFAASSSFAMLQTSRPALADQADHKPRHHQRVDRDDRIHHNTANGHWVNGQWVPNRVANNNGGHWVNGQWVPNNTNWNNRGKHKGWRHNKNHDRDHDRR